MRQAVILDPHAKSFPNYPVGIPEAYGFEQTQKATTVDSQKSKVQKSMWIIYATKRTKHTSATRETKEHENCLDAPAHGRPCMGYGVEGLFGLLGLFGLFGLFQFG